MSRKHTITGTRQRLDAVYARIPAIECRGHCATTCTSFPLPYAERRLIWLATGVDLKTRDPRTTTCPLLTDDGRCGAYDIRPLICRLWGTSAGMPCTYGCKPERVLTVAECFALTADIYEISDQRGIAAIWRRAAGKPDLDQYVPLLQQVSTGQISPDQFNEIIRKTLKRKR